jgi:hypothetical protein
MNSICDKVSIQIIYTTVLIMMVTWFKVLYTLIKEKIIRNRTWKETREKINAGVVEDPVFKIADSIVRGRGTDHDGKNV